MFTIGIVILLSLRIQGTAAHTVSVVGRHRQHFAVRDIVKRSYIRLSDKHEAELGLDMYQPDTMADESQINDKIREAKDASDWRIQSDADYDDEDDVDDEDDSEDEFEDDLESDEELEPDDADLEHELNDLAREKKDDFVAENKDDLESFFRDIDDAAFRSDVGRNLELGPGDRKKRTITHSGKTKEIIHDRKKRAAREQWRHAKTSPGETSGLENKEDNVWEGVTDEELAHGRNRGMTEIAEYIGITLLSVAGFAFVGICFIRDPVACIFAFGTGCPCCLIFCPCVRAFTDKYLDTKKLVRESMNKYMPGVIVKEDGSMDFYEPTAEEIEILHEIIEEIMDD